MRIQSGGEGCLDFRIHAKSVPVNQPCRPGCLRYYQWPSSKRAESDFARVQTSCKSHIPFSNIQRPLKRQKRCSENFSHFVCQSSSALGSQSHAGDEPDDSKEDCLNTSSKFDTDSSNLENLSETDDRQPGQVEDGDASFSGRERESTEAEKKFLRVPWRGAVIWRVMMLWTFAYMIHPHWIMTIGLDLVAGLDRAQLGSRGEALYHVALDLGMLVFTVAILWVCLKKYKPRALGWFRSRVWPPKWLFKVLIACAIAFPLAMYLGDFSQVLVPTTDAETWNYLHLEETLAAGDKITNAMYFLVLTICAPVWEEVIFRGFLLPSLTKYMPPWGAVFLTALIFACVHFSCQRFLPLLVLGVVWGGLYAESKNLLAAITAHSLWNMFVFAQVLFFGPPGGKLVF